MNREFLEHYNRELKILYERSREFAEEYPGVAERLGGLTEDVMDPGIAGLLEGAAFMAARVQLKLKSEFGEFTTALIDQILPNFLMPIPSATLVETTPVYDDSEANEGKHFRPGALMDAVYLERERRISCRYRLSSSLSVWPLHLETAQYFASPAPLQGLGLEVQKGTTSGLRLGFHRRTTLPARGSEIDRDPGAPIADVKLDSLPVHLIGTTLDSVALYEQLFADCRRITIRHLDPFGDPRFLQVGLEQLEQIGFGEDEALFGHDDRVFSGFELLREFFAFPPKFLGFRINGLRRLLERIKASRFDILFEFGASVARLQSVVGPQSFALHAVAGVNLFEMICSRVSVQTQAHEYPVVPDRSRLLDFEAHRVLEVFAHYPQTAEKIRVFPLYSIPTGNTPLADALFYTVRRLPRRATSRERRHGARSDYGGSEFYLSLREPATLDTKDRVKELSVRCLVSNRHLTDQLPVGEAGADFYLLEEQALTVRCVSPPTSPRESIINIERKQRDAPPSGARLWTLLNLLSLNHLGLTERNPEDRARGLRELLSMFTDLSDIVTERRIRGVVGVDTRPIVRRLRQANGFAAARGMEITVTFDEKAYEGSGVFLLGAVLDRFFAEYASINSFSQTVIVSAQRGVLKRWPPRSGTGLVL